MPLKDGAGRVVPTRTSKLLVEIGIDLENLRTIDDEQVWTVSRLEQVKVAPRERERI